LAPASRREHPENRSGKLRPYKQKGFDFGGFFCYYLMYSETAQQSRIPRARYGIYRQVLII